MHTQRVVVTVAASTLALSLSSCRGLDRSFDCSYQAERFEAVVDKEGILLADVTDIGTYPMALMVSEEGVNRLLNGVVGSKVPFASTMQLGPLLVEFTPSSTPVIDIASIPTCSQCVLFSLEFEFGVVQGDEGVAAGLGDAALAIPIRLDQRPDGNAVLVAEYGNATVSKMDLNVNGFDSEQHEAISGALALLATDTVREQYGDTELLTIGSLQIGNTDVRSIARDLFVVPAYDALLFGIETNLELPEGVGLTQPMALPEGVNMGLLYDPLMLLAVSQRMIVEGQIARRYNDDGDPDPEGIYGVTLHDMEPNAVADDRLDTAFRIWRTDEGYCGFAAAEMPLFLGLEGSGISVMAGDAVVTGGEGAGKIAADKEELVEKNQNLIDNFKTQLASQVGFTIDFKSIGVEGSTIFFEPLDLTVDEDSVNLFLDFIVAASE
ncbi:MAG: hypothetical protein H6711_08125 [Myxococcales bacterium]|nr:hypothetical protein [Myxococcales bacterium]